MTDVAEAMVPAEDEASPPAKRKRKPKVTERDEELRDRPEIAEKLEKVFGAVEKGFDDQNNRSDDIMDNWDAYNCVLGRYQNYTGNLSQIYVPIIKNGVDALVTRYINQAFPQSGRHVEAVTGEEEEPFALLSLVEHYIEAGKLRTQAAREILLNGQVEGQYNAYVHWDEYERFVVSRETKPMMDANQMPNEALGQVETISEEEIEDACPFLEALHDNDVLVLPVTAPTVAKALQRGGSVTIIRRWSKDEIEKKIDDGEIDEEEGEDLLAAMGGESKTKDTSKQIAGSAAGIYYSGKSSVAVVYEVWTRLKVDGRLRLCRAYYAGMNLQTQGSRSLGCKLNPFWNDRCPLLSAPVKKLPGVFKGEAPVAACMGLQIQANDAVNEAGHMLYFALAPVLTVDPTMVSKWKELVTAVAAVWPVPKDAVNLHEWPSKIREALEVVGFNKATIFETLGVNPSMLPQQTGAKSKRNQAEIALEQQVDILQTADAVTVLEGEILTPFVQFAAELDTQFREKEILVRMFGELGMQMGMDRVPPIQSGTRWLLRWSGVEQARNAANIQQMIAWFGTVMKMPPQMYMGYRLNAAPLLEYSAGQVFPARLARQIFKSMKDEMSVDPQVENQMLDQGFEVKTHAADPDPQHLQVHMQGVQQALAQGNSAAIQQYKVHIAMHQQAMQMKQQAMAAQGQQGQPGGGGGARGPRPGAQPAMHQRQPQQPAGRIHPDQMARAGAPGMPRKT